MPEKKQKIRVGLVFGGRSGEHEVSLASATSVMANLDKEKYDVVPIGITKEGSWLLGVAPPWLLEAEQGAGRWRLNRAPVTRRDWSSQPLSP